MDIAFPVTKLVWPRYIFQEKLPCISCTPLKQRELFLNSDRQQPDSRNNSEEIVDSLSGMKLCLLSLNLSYSSYYFTVQIPTKEGLGKGKFVPGMNLEISKFPLLFFQIACNFILFFKTKNV